jgi:hypothetical protein
MTNRDLENVLNTLGREPVPHHVAVLADELTQKFSGSLASSRPEPKWRHIMKSKITKFAAAAAIVLLVIGLFEFWPSVKMTGTVYGMTDIPRLLQEANTIYVHGWAFKIATEKGEVEYKVDRQNGRFYEKKPGFNPQIGAFSYIEVCDGEYLLDSCLTLGVQPYQTIRYEKVSPFYSRVETQKRFRELFMIFGNLDRVEGAQKTGKEKLDGILYDIWEGKIQCENNPVGVIMVKGWLSGSDGRIGRFEVRIQENDTSEMHIMEFDKIELDLPLDNRDFSTDPIEGYVLENTKETAPAAELSKGWIKIAFTLEDGSVIIGWNGAHANDPEQASLFQNLEIGGALPKFSLELTSLTAVPLQPPIEYPGYHLAYTCKEGRYYEWSLYVPYGMAPDRNSFMAYLANSLLNVDGERKKGFSGSLTSGDIPIKSNRDFQEWVLAAMAELSDDGRAPEYVTHDFVLNLANKLRQK